MDSGHSQTDKVPEASALTVFTVNIDGVVHRCAVSPAALYMLASVSTPQADQLDAYLELKHCVHNAVARLLHQGHSLPAVFEPEHFLLQVAFAEVGYQQ